MTPATPRTKVGIEGAMIAVAVSFIAALFAYAFSSIPGVLTFRPSFYAVIPALGIVSTLALLIIINARRTRIGYTLWFSLFLVTIIYWGVSELMLELSATAAAAVFWRPLTGIASAFTGLFILMFVAGLTRPKLLDHKPLPWTLLFGAAVTLIYLMFGTDIFINHDPDSVLSLAYGFELPFTQTGGLLYLLWLLSLETLVVIMLIKYYRHQLDPMRRRQGQIFLTGTIIFTLGTIIADVLIPSVLGDIGLPPLGQLLATIMAVLYAIGLLRYNLFVVDPATVAPNILQTMAEAVIVTDQTYRILFSNRQARILLGDPLRSIAGAGLSDAFKSADWVKLQQLVEQGVASDQTTKIGDTAIASSGRSSTFVDISVSQVLDDSNQIAGIVWVFNDISGLKEANKQLAREKAGVERKVVLRTSELAEAQARLAASLTGLPFGFAIITPQQQIAFHNQALTKLLGRAIPEGGTSSAKVLREIAAHYAPSIDILGCINESSSTSRLVQKDIAFGPAFFHFLFVPIIEGGAEQGQTAGTVMIMEDTTEKKAMDRSREEFFSIASHELRTPLTAIRGNADMILNYYPEPLKDAGLKEMVTDMHDSSIRLIAVVNDFLDSSRLEQGKIVFKPAAFDIVELVRDTLRQYDVASLDHKLSLALTEPPADLPLVLADANRVRQIIINLLSNALKFTDHGGVTITLTPTKRTMKITVTDTGKGIPVASQHLLFHKFQQAAGNILTRDDTRGTGLGLYISRLLVEGMGGTLNMTRSEVGKGSTFEFELPLAK